jgi:hypothetical protein
MKISIFIAIQEIKNRVDGFYEKIKRDGINRVLGLSL